MAWWYNGYGGGLPVCLSCECFSCSFQPVSCNIIDRVQFLWPPSSSLLPGHSLTIMWPCLDHTCQKYPQPTCVDLRLRDPGQCGNSSAHTTSNEWVRWCHMAGTGKGKLWSGAALEMRHRLQSCVSRMDSWAKEGQQAPRIHSCKGVWHSLQQHTTTTIL